MGLFLATVCACRRPTPEPAAAAPTTPAAASRATPDATAPVLTVARFRQLQPASGTHTLEGYIRRLAPCPPCPAGAECKPCMGDHLILSDKPGPFEGYGTLGEQELIVFAPSREDLNKLEEGQRRRLTVRVTSKQTTALPLHDVELVTMGPPL
ncbi:hypothetical protein F0U60_29440 [Archangium minus]|uniref:Lipoprotein n=1 Tax=Archangium minus TaxID=83450 RepID=A0ABY9WXF5_9BACT|nr:hypothetical protein F0U60_29440 [Archangium minus]